MTPVILAGGRSFKGAAAYFLHDKKASTAERVAWVETVNLPTADPDRAWRMMAHTAMSQGELKKAAGVKATGRKLTQPVFSYVLSWHATDNPTEQEISQAAHETLKALKLDGLQALIVRHTDTDKPHVHILVNRVSPENGIAAPLSNSKNDLQAWALKYQQERGQTHCPQRVENAKKRAQGERTKQARTSRDRYQDRTANDNLTADFVRAEQKAKDAHLAERDRLMTAAHARQWTDAKALYAAGKARFSSFRDSATTKAQNDLRPQHAQEWTALIEHQRAERRAFKQREGSFIGFVWNSFQTVRELRRQEIEAGREDPAAVEALTLLFAVLSSRDRRETLEAGFARARRNLGRVQRAELKGIERRSQDIYRQSVGKLHKKFLDHCGTLRTDQAKERADMKAAWRQRRAEYSAAMAPIRDRAAKWRRVEQIGQQQNRGLSLVRERTLKPPKP